MKVSVLLFTLALTPVAVADGTGEVDGLLSFNNGDQLHGRYLGFAGNRLLWQRDDLTHQAGFEMANLRRLILRSGQTEHPLPRLSEVTTVHGDLIPGRIVSLDDAALVVESAIAGRLEIPRNQISLLAPSPFGGISYQGPFSPDDWKRVELPNVSGYDDGDADGDGGADDGGDAPQGWIHSGTAWYWPDQACVQGLILNREMPSAARIRFQVSWKSRMSLALAFHADFQPPPGPGIAPGEPAPQRRRFHISDADIYGEFFGNSYILQINPSHALLYRSVVDAAGVGRVERMHTSYNNVNLGDTGSAEVELRASRNSGEISLFINDEFVAQWSEIGDVDAAHGPVHPYAGSGGGLGFLVQSRGAAVRVSDVMIADWNGMPDAARSMRTDEHDVVLLNNGTDRFSGKIVEIRDGRVAITARYGAFDVPVNEVAEIRFARNGLAKPEAPARGSIRLNAYPAGAFTGIPVSGDASRFRIDHPSCGIIDLDLRPVVLIEMHLGESFLDAWDPDL